MKKAHLLAAAGFAEADIRPLRVGRRLWIGPVGEPLPSPDLLPIRLAPGRAFGSGSHPSTELSLAALERHLPPGGRVLDLGTGTGILAVAAARLGAAEVVGVDVDPAAIAAARVNVRHNEMEQQVRVTSGTLADLLEAGAPQFSCVVINILAQVIVGFLDQGLARLLAPDGLVILSGFLRTQAHLIRAALAASALDLLAQEQLDEWCCIIARKPPTGQTLELP